MKNNIIYHNGSIQYLNIPQELKELYKTVWEIKQKHIVIQASERGPYIEQTHSMNIFMEDADFNKITSSHMTSWKLGLKTGIYYFRTKPGANAKKITIDSKDYDESECTNCSA